MLTIPISRQRLELLQTGTVVVATRPAQFSVTGPGAEECVQGVVTNDIVKPGQDSIVYGAFLTAKGMIITDGWAIRGPVEHEVSVLADPAAEAHLADLFRRQFPPRVAKVANVTSRDAALLVLGRHGPELVRSLFGVCPEPGRVAMTTLGAEAIRLAAPVSLRAPFSILITGSATGAEAAAAALTAAGALLGTEADVAAVRVANSFPALGAEIDERTMPAEVDYGGIAGVSHSKGCYVGQETVARLHFRGHPNWLLRRIRSAPGTEIPPSGEITDAGKVVIRIGTVLRLDDGSALGLGKVRREIEPGAEVGGVVVEA